MIWIAEMVIILGFNKIVRSGVSDGIQKSIQFSIIHYDIYI